VENRADPLPRPRERARRHPGQGPGDPRRFQPAAVPPRVPGRRKRPGRRPLEPDRHPHRRLPGHTAHRTAIHHHRHRHPPAERRPDGRALARRRPVRAAPATRRHSRTRRNPGIDAPETGTAAMTTRANKALLRRYKVGILNNRDIYALVQVAAPGYLDHAALPGQAQGREGLKQPSCAPRSSTWCPANTVMGEAQNDPSGARPRRVPQLALAHISATCAASPGKSNYTAL
jgi:hypothetical protein